MAEELQRARAKRAGNRAVITKLTKEADNIIKEGQEHGLPFSLSKTNRLHTINAMLEEKISIVKDLDEQVLSRCDVGEIEKEIEDSDEILSCVLDIQRCISQQLSATPVLSAHQNTSSTVVEEPVPAASGLNQATPGISPGTAAFQSSHHQTQSKLPKLVLPKFRGDATKFRTFWDSFESAVHKNPGLSKIDKFNYLYSLLESVALRAIQGLTVTDANYDAAINILNQRFGKPQQIISAHMDELLKIPACNGDKPSQLRFVYDKVSVHVRGLEALGVDASQYGSLLIPIIMAKLPQDVRVQIARNTTQDVWKIGALLAVIQREVEAREISDNVKVTSDNRKPPALPVLPRDKLSPTANTLMAQGAGKTPANKGFQCVYCAGNHYSASCDRMTDTNSRKEILKRDRRCLVCLRRGHRNDQCQQNKSCRRCQGNHHQSLCERSFQPVGTTPPVHTNSNLAGESRSRNEERTELNDQNSNAASVNHTTTTSVKGPYKVLLQTAATYAQGLNDSSPVPVRILLDSGSQRSYVTTALKERLKLAALKTETLNLNTFGDDRFTRQRCELVKLSLRGKEDDVEISALCFPKICSPLSTSLDVSRYPHLQGLDFADASVVDGSQQNIDILIGSDFYFEILTGEVVRGDSGPVAVNSKFGWVVSGPTLERGEMSDMSVANLVIEKIGSQNPYPDNENDNELSCALRRFWDIESLGIQDDADRTRESEFLPDIRFKEIEGRYEIQLPWKNNCTPKSDSYMMCSKRLFQLHSRLKKDESLLREYDQTIRQQIDSKIIEECEKSQDTEDRSHFLPHHGVIKQDRQTTKLRVVFDGSAKSSNDDLSLIDFL